MALKRVHGKSARVCHREQEHWLNEFPERSNPRDFPWILAAIQVLRKKTGHPVRVRGPHFYRFFDFLAGSRSGFLRSCSSAFSQSIDTGIGIIHSLHRSCQWARWRRSRRQAWDHDSNVVLRSKTNLNTISNETWLLTSGPQEYPWSSPTFPSDNTTGVSSRIFTVKNISDSLT